MQTVSIYFDASSYVDKRFVEKFCGNLKIDHRLWLEKQNAAIAEGSVLRIERMDIMMPNMLLRASEWVCRLEFKSKLHLLWINGLPIAAWNPGLPREFKKSEQALWDDVKSLPEDLLALRLEGYINLTGLRVLQNHRSLEYLDVAWSRGLTAIDGLQELTNLKHVSLRECLSITDFSPLSLIRNLESVDLSRCRQLTDLSPLSALADLRQLDLSYCEMITDLSPLCGLRRLRNLQLEGCKSLADISPVSSLPLLETINLHACQRVSDLWPSSNCTHLRIVDVVGLSRVRNLEALSSLDNLRSLSCANDENDFGPFPEGRRSFSTHFHPSVVAECLANAAFRRRDVAYVFENADIWRVELLAAEAEGHEILEKMSSTLASAFGLLSDTTWGDLIAELLDRHPEFTSGPWKAWFGGTLKESGFDLYRSRVERVAVLEMTSGAIGGVCSTLPLEEQLDWSCQWLAELEKSRLRDAKTLLSVAPEICMAYARSADRRSLRRWLEAFTDPSDPTALDPVHVALARFQIGGDDLAAAENHVHAIQSPRLRDPILSELVVHLAEREMDLASASLLLIENQSLRADLAKKLAAKASASEVLIHRCIVAAGESPQDLADLISVIPSSSRSELVAQFSKKLQTDRKDMLLKVAEDLRRQADRLSAQALAVD